MHPTDVRELHGSVRSRVVDSVIEASDFGLELVGGEPVDPATIAYAFDGAPLEIRATRGRTVAFRAARRLAFAFTCASVERTSAGAIRAVHRAVPSLGTTTRRDRGYSASKPASSNSG